MILCMAQTRRNIAVSASTYEAIEFRRLLLAADTGTPTTLGDAVAHAVRGPGMNSRWYEGTIAAVIGQLVHAISDERFAGVRFDSAANTAEVLFHDSDPLILYCQLPEAPRVLTASPRSSGDLIAS